MKVVLLTGACVLCAGLLGVAVAGGSVLPGRERAAVLPDRLDGGAVARMAERELEAENPRMAVGRLTCPGLRLRIGVSVRCRRTTELSEGRVVTVSGTVTVTALSSGGRLHVAMDDRAEEFGLSGDRVATGVRDAFARRLHLRPTRVSCPYLRGVVGARVTCRVDGAGRRRTAEVEVTGVDAADYRTAYAVRLGHTSLRHAS